MIAYQGEPGSFSEQAAKMFFGKSAKLLPLPTFKDVFEKTDSKSGKYAIVPIENSLFGSIHPVYDLLLKHKLVIIGEVKLRIELNLMALQKTNIKNVKVIYSQLQAIGQCENFLNKLKNVKVEAVHDTAAAARMIKESQQCNAAAIASERAALTHNLKILKRNIENDNKNFTRFIVLSKHADKAIEKKSKLIKTSILFATDNKPGALCKSLALFALRGINLLKVESRPIVGKPWEYIFYLDVEGSPNQNPLKMALNHLQKMSRFMRILGYYKPY